MKKIKYIFSVLLFLLIFILSSELYQSYLKTFTGQFQYFEISEQTNRRELHDLLKKVSLENNMSVFSVSYKADTMYLSTLEVYVTPESKEILEHKYNVKSGIYNSFFSGMTQVVFKDFSEIVELSSIERYYFTGTFEQVRETRNTVYNSFAASYVHQEENGKTRWIVWAVWGMSIALLLMLTWLDIQFQKKENFIRISLGASSKGMVLKNIVFDTICFSSIFFVIRIALGYFISLDYVKDDSVIVFSLFIIGNIVLHLTGLKYDYKEILYGANINLKTIGNSYVLKAITMMVTIVSLAVTLGLIMENAKYFKMYDEIKKYEKDSFLSVKANTANFTDEQQLDCQERVEAQIFYDAFSNGDIALAVYNTVNEYGNKYFLVNKNTSGVNALLEKNALEDFDGYYILVPKDLKNSEQIAEDAYLISSSKLEGFYESSEYQVIYYDNFELLYFDSALDSELPFGFGKEKNPIMIYCAFDRDSSISGSACCDILGRTSNDIIYCMDDIEISELMKKYNLTDVSPVKVTDRCNQYRVSMLRIILLNSVIFTFMLFLEIIMIVTLIRMEYVVKAKELAVKKILGYSVWSKNKQLFVLNLLSATISIIIVMMSSLMFEISQWYYILAASILLVMVEFVITYYYIIKIERINVPKILKGGSL